MAINNLLDDTRSQTFTYDALNRIATAAASTYAQSSANCWGESFTIDRYGNLASRCHPEPGPAIVAGTAVRDLLLQKGRAHLVGV